ncbi:MAG: cyclic nucleotide-binding domain-containing protein [Alphaproteobacteria bacterium]|nr:cyclic nucleotide-binding domain-containing protein [Alphaproteobacteria bacterium]
MNLDDHIASLERIELFESLPRPALSRIGAQMKLRQYHRGEVIVWQGKPSESFFVLREGIAAVERSLPGQMRPKTVAYIMPGSTFGEVGILENQPRSASIVALTDLEVLVLRREAFLAILGEHATVAIALARGLGRALVEATRRQLDPTRRIRVILVVSATGHSGKTLIGHAMATVLARQTSRPTVHTEYPVAQGLQHDLGLAPDVRTHSHPAGYEVFLPPPGPAEDGPGRARLLLDRMLGGHDNIVIGLTEEGWDSAMPLWEHANQVLVVTAPSSDAPAAVDRLYERIRRHVSPDRAGVFVVVNRPRPSTAEAGFSYDFMVPYLDALPPLTRSGVEGVPLAEPLKELAQQLFDRLDRTHQVSVYIPTTLQTDQPADTSAYVQRTLDFLGQRFGGATSMSARGVWRSHQVGLVREDVYVVRTYATQADMNEHLDQVVEYTRTLKAELGQEAMALEVDRKLVLI